MQQTFISYSTSGGECEVDKKTTKECTLKIVATEGPIKQPRIKNDGKKSSHTGKTEVSEKLCSSCGIRKTTLRQRLHNTDKIFCCFRSRQHLHLLRLLYQKQRFGSRHKRENMFVPE